MQDDAQSVCSGVDPHDGRVQECLRERRQALSYDCQAELFRQEQEDSEDLRLSVRLFHKCLNDKIKVGGWMAGLPSSPLPPLVRLLLMGASTSMT